MQPDFIDAMGKFEFFVYRKIGYEAFQDSGRSKSKQDCTCRDQRDDLSQGCARTDEKIESGAFDPADIDLFQDLQWIYARKLVSRPAIESVDIKDDPD